LFRRRREGKTDYRKRKGIIVGRSPFLAVRISGKYIYAQILKAAPTGDLTLCASSSRELGSKFGWKGSAKSIPSAYLTGYYLGRLAGQNDVKTVVVYSGVGRFVHGSRIASVINGAKDAGLEIEVNEESLPEEARLKGSHIASYAGKLEKEDASKYNQTFSKLISSGLKPTEYPAHFDQVKAAIEKGSAS
jgi:large subunit ribosomal protein L18